MSLFRLFQAGLTLARADALLPREFQARFPAPLRAAGVLLRLFARRDPTDLGARMARALERLGPAYIKLGQFLATRPDIVGPDAATALSGLKDRLAPFPIAAATAALSQEFGPKAKDLFGRLSEPVAAASIAQVHKTTTADGRVLAVKVLRPDVERQISRDIQGMEVAARILERHVASARRLEPVAFVATLKAALEREVDLRLEAAAANEFAEIADADGYLAAPAVDWPRTAKRVCAFAWVEGAPLTDLARVDALGADRASLAVSIVRGFLAAALDHGFFHADMHEGNILYTPGGRLVAVDFGIMGRISAAERRYLAEILWGFIQRDYKRIAQTHFDAGYVPADRNVDDFAMALRAVGEPIFGRTADEVSMGRLLLQLFDITHQFGMHLRPELVLLQKTMVQVEGVARTLDPRLDMWSTARPIVERWMRRELGPEARLRRGVSDIEAVVEAARRLPSALTAMNALETRLAEGGLTLAPQTVQALAQSQAKATRWRAIGGLAIAALAAWGLLAH